MKILFFLALLANLVFFIWQYNAGAFHHAEHATELATSKPKQIWLLSELEKIPSTRTATTQNLPVVTAVTHPAIVLARVEKNNPQPVSNPTKVSPAKVPAITTAIIPATPATTVNLAYCYKASGFSDKATATRWAETLAISSLHIKEIPPIVTDYLVNYPAAATFAESKKNISLLKEHGVNNFFMINQGEFKGAISLGVFKNEARAMKAQRVFMQKGLDVKVSKRYKTAPRIDLHFKTTKTQPELVASLTAYAPKTHLELLSQCE